jgi:hypothetical protein
MSPSLQQGFESSLCNATRLTEDATSNPVIQVLNTLLKAMRSQKQESKTPRPICAPDFELTLVQGTEVNRKSSQDRLSKEIKWRTKQAGRDKPQTERKAEETGNCSQGMEEVSIGDVVAKR